MREKLIPLKQVPSVILAAQDEGAGKVTLTRRGKFTYVVSLENPSRLSDVMERAKEYEQECKKLDPGSSLDTLVNGAISSS